jgi:hypothetical protein
MKQSEVLPIAIVFHPNWWHKNNGIKFDRSFFFDPEARVENDRFMRQFLFERFSDLALGEQYAEPIYLTNKSMRSNPRIFLIRPSSKIY